MALEASEVAVRVRLVGGSAFETDAAKVAASTEAIGTAGKKASDGVAASFGSIGGKLDHVGSKMMSFGRTMTMASIPIVAAGYYASKTAMSFGRDMTLLSTQAGESSKNLGWMSREVFNLGKQFGQTPDAMAQALYWFESIGDHGTKALKDLRAAMLGSAVGLDSLENTANAVSTVMASHIKGSGGPIEAMSLMDMAIGRGKMHLQDLNDSFKSAIVPMSQQFGMSFRQILAAEAALTRLGIPSAQVSSRMRLMLTSMVAPTAAGLKVLSALHVAPGQLASDLRSPGGLMTALEDLKMITSRLNPIQRDQVLATLFGRSRGMGQITASLSALPQAEQIYATIMGTTSQTLLRHFAQTTHTTAFKEHQVRAQFDADMVKLGDTVNTRILPVILRLIPYLQDAVNFFGMLPHPLQDVALGFGVLAATAGPLFLFTGALFRGAGMMMTGIETIVGAEGMGALRAGMAITAAEFAAIAAPVAAAVTVFELFDQKHGVFADARHAIGHAGYKTGEGIVNFLHDTFGILGGSYRSHHLYDYIHGSEFEHYNPIIRSDIEGLMNPRSYQRSHLRQVERDFAEFGKNVNLNDIPGISDAIRHAIKEGMKDTSLTVVLPNGRVLAQTVNDENRRNQNRR